MGSVKNKKGFTLIELIVVMIIIGILVLLATPRFINYIKLARYTNIINDTKVVETVVLPEMVKNKMKFPKGTSKNPVDIGDILKEVRNEKAYMKDGYLVEDGKRVDFKPLVGHVSTWVIKNTENILTKTNSNTTGLEGFYLLDKENYIKKETRTRLPGEFIVDKEGNVIYLDIRPGQLNTLKPGKENKTTYKIKYINKGLKEYEDNGGMKFADNQHFIPEIGETTIEGVPGEKIDLSPYIELPASPDLVSEIEGAKGYRLISQEDLFFPEEGQEIVLEYDLEVEFIAKIRTGSGSHHKYEDDLKSTEEDRLMARTIVLDDDQTYRYTIKKYERDDNLDTDGWAVVEDKNIINVTDPENKVTGYVKGYKNKNYPSKEEYFNSLEKEYSKTKTYYLNYLTKDTMQLDSMAIMEETNIDFSKQSQIPKDIKERRSDWEFINDDPLWESYFLGDYDYLMETGFKREVQIFYLQGEPTYIDLNMHNKTLTLEYFYELGI